MHLWHYERLSELLGKLQARFPEPVWRELGQAVSAHATRVAAPQAGRGAPRSQADWTAWDRPFDTVPGENILGTVFCPQAVRCAAGSLVEGAIWAGGEITVERNVVVQGPVVSRQQIDWQGRRAQCLIAPRLLLGRPAFPLDIKGNLLCQNLVLGADACISGTLDGLLIVSGRIARRDTGQALRSLLVLAGTAAEGVDVPCAVTLEDHVRIDYLRAGGDVVLGESCRAESVSGQNVVLGAGSSASHVHARGSLVLGPDSVVQTAIAGGRIAVDVTARVEGDLIASASGEVEIDGVALDGIDLDVWGGKAFDPGGARWYADPQYQYRANVAALQSPAAGLDPGAQLDPSVLEGSMLGWAAVRSLPRSLYRQLEGLQSDWCATLRPLSKGEAT